MVKNPQGPMVVLFAALLVAGCESDNAETRAGSAARSPLVEAVEVLHGSLPLEERLAGTVRARNQTEIFAEVNAPIIEVLVNDGDFVRAGDPLVRLRARDFDERLKQAQAGLQVAGARVSQAEAALHRAELTLDRITTLAARGLASTAELDTTQADAQAARADLQLMLAQRDQAISAVSERREELSNTLVKAPIDGAVGSRSAEIGQQAGPGTRLFVIGDTSEMRVRVTLTEHMLRYVAAGTPVNLYSDLSPEEIIRAKVTRISPFLNPVSHSADAEIEVTDHRGLLRPGMFVTVDLLYGESELAALVPNSALYRHPRDGREGVYVTDLKMELGEVVETSVESEPSSVRFVPVTVIARGREVSGVSGVAPGDWVVTLGHHLLSTRDAAEAVVQPVPWTHIISLQRMQSRDLFEIIREKQAAADQVPAS